MSGARKAVQHHNQENCTDKWDPSPSFQHLLPNTTVGRPSRPERESDARRVEMYRNMDKIKVLLADDNETVLVQVRFLLGEEFEIVGSVNNGRDAISEVQRLNPDVLLIDISMPILDGLQTVSRLNPNCRAKVVFLTIHEDQDYVDAAFAVGASGYVAKSDVTSDLVPAIREVLKGGRFISKSIAP